MSTYRDRAYGRYRAGGAADTEMTHGRLAFLRAFVKRHFPPKAEAVIVELGCGAGHLLRVARDAGYRNVSGIDASADQVLEARRLANEGVSEGDALEYIVGVSDDSVDCIVTFDVLEHLTKDEAFRLGDQTLRVLKKGGRWLIHTVNAESPFFGRVRYGDVTHEQAFTRGSLDQMLKVVGFSAVRCFEDRPAVHGVASAVRRAAWSVTRAMLVGYLVAESGPAQRDAILSQNLTCVAIR